MRDCVADNSCPSRKRSFDCMRLKASAHVGRVDSVDQEYASAMDVAIDVDVNFGWAWW